jgi:uncharacterized protein (TIGR03086 family)
MTIDLAPAADRMATLVRNVRDDQLAAATPCPAYTLGELLDHVGGGAFAFAAAANKDLETGSQAPSADASRLGDDWRDRIPRLLEELAAAWRQPDAWTGMTRAGGVDLPGEVAGLVALDELVVHGWDVAKASGQDYAVDDASLDGAWQFVSQFSGPGHDESRAGLFGPEVEVPSTASKFDRLLGMAGRDPEWSGPDDS